MDPRRPIMLMSRTGEHGIGSKGTPLWDSLMGVLAIGWRLTGPTTILTGADEGPEASRSKSQSSRFSRLRLKEWPMASSLSWTDWGLSLVIFGEGIMSLVLALWKASAADTAGHGHIA